ncbi:hypothetical protein [uncultured Ferrimonas sp.]|uniref:hypothetical protein n=1 Tax=uncultured Ferrimonas sp. TaxID=432640 RepID=UPI00262AF9B1|nr:hypothetical protein [uncultured Ferrimonas sp.]
MPIELISSFLALIISGVTIPFLISRIRMTSIKYHTLNLEHYEKLRQLCGKDANENLSTLLVALNCVTKRALEPKFIEWFLYTPGAYCHIKKFGMCKKYLSIDIESNKFIWNTKYVERKNRWKTQISIFLLYTFCGTLGISPLIAYELLLKQLGLIPAMFAFVGSILLLILAAGLLFSLTLMDDAARLIKTEIN